MLFEWVEKYLKGDNLALLEVTKLVNGQHNFCLTVDNENEKRNVGGDIRYFKYYNSKKPTNATGVARISLVNPVYIIHPSGSPKTIYLGRPEKKQLVRFLKSACKTPTDDGIFLDTNYQYMIYYFNKVSFNMDIADILNFTRNKKINIVENAIPIDYEMPDYMNL